MISLYIDSSKKSLSVALASGNKLLFKSNILSYSRHSNYLMNEIEKAIKTTNINIEDIDNYIVVNGPGSFTGLRVGVTVVKTLAYALKKKLYEVSSLEVLKVQSDSNDLVISIIYDKKDASYVGIFDGERIIQDYISINDINDFKNKSIMLVSDCENVFLKEVYDKLKNDNKVSLKIIDEENYLKNISYALTKKDINPHIAKPIYLKKIDVEKV